MGDRSHSHDAPRRRVFVRSVGGSVRPAFAVDDRHYFLFGDGVTYSLRAEFHGLAHSAGPLWNRHGRRVGSRGIPRDGVTPGEGAWVVLGNFATRLRLRLSAGGHRLLDRISLFWMARTFRRRGHAGTARNLHPGTGAGITRLEEAGKRFRYRHHLDLSAVPSTVHLCRPTHDGV